MGQKLARRAWVAHDEIMKSSSFFSRIYVPVLLLSLGAVAGYAATRSAEAQGEKTTKVIAVQKKQKSTQKRGAADGGSDEALKKIESVKKEGAVLTTARIREKDAGSAQPEKDTDVEEEPLYIRQYVKNSRSKLLLHVARKVGAKPVALDVACRIFAEDKSCTSFALDRFFLALDRLEKTIDVEEKQSLEDNDIRMVTLGNSLIASDRITNIARARFQQRFGKGGGGFFLVDRQADYGGRARTGYANSSWKVYNFSQGDRGRYVYGLTGVHHVSTRKGARTTWRVQGETEGRLFWVNHRRSPSMNLFADDHLLLHIEPSSEGKFSSRRGALADTAFKIPAGTTKLRLVVNGRNGVVEGLSLNSIKKGAHFDAFGVVAADAKVWLSADEETFEKGLRYRNPHLVLLMLGGNEVRRVAWGKYGYKTVRQKTEALIERVQKAVPKSDCLVVGPLHAVRGKNHKTPFGTRPQLARVNQIFHEVALKKGCAFLDMYQAMGGKKALKRFYEHRMLHEDLVHPRGKGLDLLGEFIFQGIVKSWVESPVTKVPELFEADVSAASLPKENLKAPLSERGTELVIDGWAAPSERSE